MCAAAAHPPVAACSGVCFAAATCVDASGVMFDGFLRALAEGAAQEHAHASSSSSQPAAAPSSPLTSLRLNPCFLSSPSTVSPFSSLTSLHLSRHSSAPPWPDAAVSLLLTGLQVSSLSTLLLLLLLLLLIAPTAIPSPAAANSVCSGCAHCQSEAPLLPPSPATRCARCRCSGSWTWAGAGIPLAFPFVFVLTPNLLPPPLPGLPHLGAGVTR